MYSEMKSTSALYPSYPHHQNQSSDEKPNPGFGEQHYEQFNGNLYSVVNPDYSTSGSYPLHQNLNHGFGVKDSSMTNNGPFPYPGFTYRPLQEALTHPVDNHGFDVKQSSMMNNGPFSYRGFTYRPLQEALPYPVHQPAAAQAQEQKVQVKRNAEEEVLVVKVEPPNFPKSRPRLTWTPELHARFIRAAIQLGGLFEATPKAILGIMNVRGLTLDHLKSHLQKMRCKYPNDISAEEFMGHGIQNNTNSHAPQVTEGEASSSSRPKFEWDIGKYGRLLGSYETPNYRQTIKIAPGEDHVNFSDFEDFDLFS